MHVVHTSDGQFEHVVSDFVAANGIKKLVAIAGGAEDDSSKLDETIYKVVEDLSQYPVGILTGGTKWGVPRIAAEAANTFGVPVIGVYPQRGRKYIFEGLDLPIEVDSRICDSEWGDGTEVFVKLANAIIFFGGSFGTQIEYSFLMKTNEGRLQHEIDPIYFVPVIGFGGWSEIIYNLSLPENMGICFPEVGVTKAQEISDFLIQKLF